MASSTITSWQIEGENVEAVTDFIFLSSKITVDGDCSHEIKRCLLSGRKAITNLDSVLKSKDVTLPTKTCIVKAMVFQVVMYICESRIIKEAERWRIDAFKLWCWRRFLRVPWTARRSNHFILKEINPEYSLKGLMLKLKLQYFGYLMQTADSFEKILILGKIEGRRREYSLEGMMLKLKLQCFIHLMWRTDSFEKTLMLGKTEGRRRRGRQRMRWLDGITALMDMSLSRIGVSSSLNFW